MHYFVEPLERILLEDILMLLDQQKYFVLHAPRQTGKTSYLLSLMDYLNRESEYTCLYTNVETAQAAREDVKEGIRAILSSLASDALRRLEDPFVKENWQRIFDENGPFVALEETLQQWCSHSQKPIVLFLDEIDSLVGDTLISVLRQLRSGYEKRPSHFPHSIVLCGVRDVRDYRIHSAEERSVVTGGSAFNIKAESIRFEDFSFPEVEALLLQHTEETGQEFAQEVLPLIWELTEGQPWLVNALAYEACFKSKEGRDRSTIITDDMVVQAKEAIILRRETHLDQLADKLAEERVRRVIEPVLAGSLEPQNISDDDVQYVIDLGLIQPYPQLRIANRIYQEIIPRELTYISQLTISHESAWYVREDGSLDMDKLLTAFQDFFRKHFDSWIDGFNYREAGPQLLLQAFLQRIINGGGRVEREYGLGRQRTDLLLAWPYDDGVQEVVIELKLRYGSLEKTIETGLEQILGYMDTCGTDEGYLLIFDRTAASWNEKIFKKLKTINSIAIPIFGM